MVKNQPIRTLAEDDRPRLKLLQKGRKYLSDSELLAILINSGTRDKSAIELSREILRSCNNSLHEFSRFTVEELCRFKGIGEAKAITVVAALELGRRRKAAVASSGLTIRSSKDSYRILRPLLEDLRTEEFYCLFLNRGNKVIRKVHLSSGGVNKTVVDNRVIFKMALDCLASGIIIAHNHPSGQTQPSEQDVLITQRIRIGASLLEIELLDHLILTDNGYFSFADKGII